MEASQDEFTLVLLKLCLKTEGDGEGEEHCLEGRGGEGREDHGENGQRHT